MSELREAAQAVVDAKDNPLNSIEDIEQVVERLRAALAKPETEAEPVVEPVAWQVRWIDPEEGPGPWRICLDPSEADYYANREDHDWRPLYTHPPRDEWRPASEPPDTTRSVLIWLRFGDVETFGKTLGGPSGFAFQNGAITHWRDIEPPEQEGE